MPRRCVVRRGRSTSSLTNFKYSCQKQAGLEFLLKVKLQLKLSVWAFNLELNFITSLKYWKSV
jgi:hypothetical protein